MNPMHHLVEHIVEGLVELVEVCIFESGCFDSGAGPPHSQLAEDEDGNVSQFLRFHCICDT